MATIAPWCSQMRSKRDDQLAPLGRRGLDLPETAEVGEQLAGSLVSVLLGIARATNPA
jgi:hypothetical protein